MKPFSVLLSMGSNIAPDRNLVRAYRALDARFGEIRCSKVYETRPAVGASGPSFLNAALAFETALDPATLKFQVLRPLEAELGRRRGADRNAPRRIDLDIALHGDLVVDDPLAGIRIPDPDVLRWAHVAIPLADIAPERIHPVDGRSLAEIAASVENAAKIRVIAPDIDALLVS